MDNTKEQQKNYIKLTTAPVERLVCSLALPTIVSMLITSIYNMADTYYVSKIDTNATAAVGIVFSLMAIIQAIGFCFGHGSGNYISRELGKKNLDKAYTMSSVGFFSAILSGLCLTIFGLIFLEPLVKFLGATPSLISYAKDYTALILIGAPYMTASLVLNNQLRFQGSARYAMMGIASGAVLNMVLDPIFIFVFHMGVAGAGLATIISQFVSFCLLLYGCTKGGNIKISLKHFKPTLSLYKTILSGGLPSLLRQGLGSVATIALNFVAGFYGEIAIAAMSVVSRITFFAASILLGFGQGFQPVCGFNYGAGLFQRVRKGYFFCLKLSTIVFSLLAIVGFIFAPSIVSLFSKTNTDVVDIGVRALRFQCITLPLNGTIIISNMLLQTIGKSTRASILAISRQGLFFLPLVFILNYFFKLTGMEMSQAVSDILTFAITIPLTLPVLKEMKNK